MKTRTPVLLIVMTLLIDAMGIGLIMPIMPDLIMDVGNADLANAALWGGILSLSFAVMQFFFSPVVGNLSDRFGRRPVLLVSLGILTLDYALMAVAGSIWLLFIGRIIGGISSATHSTATAYMADISDPDKKAQNFGLVSAAFGIGFVLGPIMGGLLGEFGPRMPFIVAMCLAGLNFALAFFFLPETLRDENRRPFEWRRANPVGAFKVIGALPGLRPLLFINFFYQIAFFVYPTVWAYFTKARFGWEPAMVGYSLAAFGIGMAIVQGGLIRVIIPKYGEEKTLMFGLVFNLIAFAATAVVPWGWLLIALTPLTALGAVAQPALMGIASRKTDKNQQGELQGLLTSIGSIGMMFSTLIMTSIFWFFTRDGAPIHAPSAPFVASGALMGLCIFIYATHRTHSDKI